MIVEALAAHRFQRDVVIEARFLGEFLEQGRHAADGAAQRIRRIEVMHLVGLVMHGGGMRREGEAVADEQDFGGGEGRQR